METDTVTSRAVFYRKNSFTSYNASFTEEPWTNLLVLHQLLQTTLHCSLKVINSNTKVSYIPQYLLYVRAGQRKYDKGLIVHFKQIFWNSLQRFAGKKR